MTIDKARCTGTCAVEGRGMGSARSVWRGHRCRAVADKRADDRPFCRFFPGSCVGRG